MATNIKSNYLGGIYIQSGDGIPIHLSPVGSIYIDLTIPPTGFLSNGNGTWNNLGTISSGTSGFDVFVTGGTYSAGTAVFTNNSGNTFSVTGFSTSNTNSTFTGGTVTGSTNFANGLTANTFSATTYLGLPMDIYSTGLTINNATYDLKIIRNDGVILTANLGTLASDVTITGGTYNTNTGVVTFYNNTGGTFSVSGFTTGITDTTVTSFTYNNANKFTIGDSTGGTFTATINTVTGLTVNGSLIATTYLGLPVDVLVTGGTYSNGTATFTNNTGGTFNISGFFTGSTDIYATGFTNSNNIITLTNNTGGTLSTIFNTVTGFTVNGSLSATDVTANTISVNPIIGLSATTAQTINLSLSDQFSYTLSGNTTFTFTNNSNGRNFMTAVSSNPTTSGYTATFTATTASIKWQNGVIPIMTPTTGRTDVYSFSQINGTIYGSYIQNFV